MGVITHKSGPRYGCPECHLSIEVARTDETVEGDLLALLSYEHKFFNSDGSPVLARKNDRISPFQFHFSIGQAF